VESEAASLGERLARLEDRVPSGEFQTLRADLDALEAKFGKHEVQ
jgi:hypothetical protein